LRKTTRRENRELKRLTTTSRRSLAMWGSALRLIRAVPALNRLVKHATLVIYDKITFVQYENEVGYKILIPIKL